VNHQLESRMREIRLSGSEGGGSKSNCFSLPLSTKNSVDFAIATNVKLRSGKPQASYVT
jgi:hypothetical protein